MVDKEKTPLWIKVTLVIVALLITILASAITSNQFLKLHSQNSNAGNICAEPIYAMNCYINQSNGGLPKEIIAHIASSQVSYAKENYACTMNSTTPYNYQLIYCNQTGNFTQYKVNTQLLK